MNKILVLMSTYNGEKFLRAQIDSILKQTNVKTTLIIRDDGSIDETINIITQIQKKCRNVELVEGDNVGAAHSFLELMKIAEKRKDDFDFFAFSDQDDYWLEEKLSQASAFLSSLPQDKPALYFSNLYITGEDLKNRSLMYKSELRISKSHLLVESFASGCTMLFNTVALESFLKYPIRYLRIHDLRFMHMCLFLGNIVYDRNAYILYRQHGHNVIGANYYLRQRINSKIKSMKCLWKQHFIEEEASEILYSYGASITQEDQKIVSIVANFRHNLSYRLKLLFSPGSYDFNMHRKEDNFWFKIRILLGVV